MTKAILEKNTQIASLPDEGMTTPEVAGFLESALANMTGESAGKLAATAFWGTDQVKEITREAYERFSGWNALFTFQEPGAARIESDVIDICVGLGGGSDTARGNLTSGGTESNFCALQAMRAWARKHRGAVKKPNVIAPYSIHATVHKAAKVLDIEIKTVPQGPFDSLDLQALADLIDANTIGLMGSAPSWPYGQVDPITEMGEIALERNIWLHVDGCVGTYILPFFRELGEEIPAYDLSVPGVRSLSGDLHKYGFAPKPLSTILWASQEEQSYHFLPITDWPCGLYISQSLVGSRPFAPIAAAWGLFNGLGRKGYLENARRLLETRDRILLAATNIEGLVPWPTHGPLVQIGAEGIEITSVIGGMVARGWNLLGVQKPPAIHLTIDLLPPEDLDRFVNDLADVTAAVRDGGSSEEGLLSYGGVAAEETAPKWLLSAIEIFGHPDDEGH
ncbi:pyridoxal phosphate-dependent decarboxylase family protein [Rhodobacteraceae bacterium nBUS_24]|jgi:sphinganine-1-phosphate aldolase